MFYFCTAKIQQKVIPAKYFEKKVILKRII